MENIQATLDNMRTASKVFRAGTKAYYDCHFMLPCVVLEVLQHSYGWRSGNAPDVRIRLTVSSPHGAWQKGEELIEPAWRVVPREMRIKRRFDNRVNTLYQYVPEEEAGKEPT